ncbi:HNH endonuclease signature motif containing protein [Corynebacterium singulare]|nr:HNH endonuclease signature motif containing protein [Corynebacterium singulare]
MNTTTPTAFFSHMNPECALAVERSAARRADYRSWTAAMPPLDEDFDVACQRLVAKLGVGVYTITECCLAVHRLTELPQVKNLQDTSYLLDMKALIAIDCALTKLGNVPKEMLALVDDSLATYLTPTSPNQVFPTPAQIGRKVRDICKSIDTTVSFRDTRKKDTYTMTDTGKRAILELNTDSATGMILDSYIREAAKKNGISSADALKKLIAGSITPASTIILHTYQATDIENAPTFVQGYGWTSQDMPATRTRDFSAEPAASDNYVVAELIRKFVEGRDGTCRALGCNRPAYLCQMDHRINFADGGPTHPSNLASLCQHHHNMKTDGRAHYIMDPITGDIVWLFEDGTWAMTEPTGPLANKTKRWAQTVAQKITATRERAHEQAQALKEELDAAAAMVEPEVPNTPPEDIPF